MAVGCLSCKVLVMAHRMAFGPTDLGTWCRMWNPYQGCENQVPLAPKLACSLVGAEKEVQHGLADRGVLRTSFQSACRRLRLPMIHPGMCAMCCRTLFWCLCFLSLVGLGRCRRLWQSTASCFLPSGLLSHWMCHRACLHVEPM